MRVTRRVFNSLLLLSPVAAMCAAQSKSGWRAATPEELEGFLPARAQVDKERIESEMRTASGIVNAKGQMVASVVLITAGYAAEGKYSHYFLTQVKMKLGDSLELPPGAYVIGWKRTDAGLQVHLFNAGNVKDLGMVLAPPIPQPRRVESFRIWPPEEQRYIQIGRYMLPYSVAN
jgi:hypothetical protein